MLDSKAQKVNFGNKLISSNELCRNWCCRGDDAPIPESRRALEVGEHRVAKVLMMPSEFVLLTKSYSVSMSLKVLSVLFADNKFYAAWFVCCAHFKTCS